ncbi:MAG: transcriptional repressor [Flavobacteriales bacterium]|nr:transcriptional repressor [Flavobacteriales bacterium]
MSIQDKLIKNKIKPTAMRLLVLQQLMLRTSAVGLTELENSFEKADRTTLYRTLKTFEKNKLIHSIDDGTGITKYALCLEGCKCSPEDLHVHFHCNNCKETFCVTQTRIPTVKLPVNFQLSEINMVIKGTCGNCRE